MTGAVAGLAGIAIGATFAGIALKQTSNIAKSSNKQLKSKTSSRRRLRRAGI